jgi:hypothetical protein
MRCRGSTFSSSYSYSSSGLIHLHLWDIAYRHVQTLDVLFLVQVIVAVVLLAITAVLMRPGRA